MSALLTSSRLKDARACQHLHHLEFELGYRPLTTEEVLRFGTLIHRGLEAWWTLAQMGVNGEERLERTVARLREEEVDPFELARAEVMLFAYHLRWIDEPYEVLAVEVAFETELRNPETGAASRTWRLAGKIDVIVRDLRDGRVLVVEHKTSSEDVSPGSDYWKRLRMDGQVSIYFEGGKALGHDIAACLYDVLSKPALRPYKATPNEDRKYKKDGTLYANQRAEDETPEEFRQRLLEALAENPNRYLARGEVVRLEQEMAEALWDVWQLGVQLREAKSAGRHPRNPDACVRYGRTCPFFDVCTGAASLEDVTRFRRVENVHPELSTESKGEAA